MKEIIKFALSNFKKYRFLISQLVNRDFTSKYKRSLFGILWSLLNPLLTMLVQFFVFSTIFKADTLNYPIYLISGVVCFNFFADATTQGALSLISNSHLLNKVYLPKYIFPFTKTISAGISFAISAVPLLVVSVLTGIRFTPTILLCLYFIICEVIFSFGVGLALSALTVFFRDIQFLWTVIIQIWTYATPIFYPAEIISDKYKFIVQINPLYHFIGNFRKCLMYYTVPDLSDFLVCGGFAIVSLAIGTIVFRKTQDKLNLYL